MKRLLLPVFAGLALLIIPGVVCAGDLPDAHAVTEQPATPEPASHESDSYPRFHIIGFSDFNYGSVERSDRETTSGFFEGQFVLHFTSQLTERFTYFAEVSMIARDDQFRTEVERTILKYDFSDRLKLSAGRYHTPINYWNVAFHHGQFLQTTISRPEMVRFGGDFLPVHFVGAAAEGSFPASGLNLNYQIGVGNGRSSIISRPGDAGDVNGSRAVTAGFFIMPDRLYALRIGGGVYFDRVTRDTRAFDERIVVAHAVWTRESPEVMGEYARVTHGSGGSESMSSDAWYLQVAYRLPNAPRFKPYARYERMKIDPRDPILSNVDPLKLQTVGLRFDAGDVVALKGEYRRDSEKRLYDHAFFVQLSFTF